MRYRYLLIQLEIHWKDLSKAAEFMQFRYCMTELCLSKVDCWIGESPNPDLGNGKLFFSPTNFLFRLGVIEVKKNKS